MTKILTPKDLEAFNKDLAELCEKHGVLISAEYSKPQIVITPKPDADTTKS